MDILSCVSGGDIDILSNDDVLLYPKIRGEDRTTVSRHLNELKDLDLITSNARGRESVYDITLPVRMMFEMEYMPQEVRREGEDIREGEVTYGKAQNN